MKFFSYLAVIFGFLWKLLSSFRTIVANLLFLTVLVVLFFALFNRKGTDTHVGQVLLIDPSGRLIEAASATDTSQALLRLFGQESGHPAETSVQDIIAAIGRAATDPGIKAIMLDPSDLQGCDTTKLLDITQALRAFKSSGKPVLARSTYYTQGQYLLASAADSISIASLGGVAITGYGLYQNYYKGLLDKLGVNVHVFRVGEFKSAVEPLIRDSMSAQARQSGKKWLDGLWQAYLGEVGRNRSLSPDAVAGYVADITTGLHSVQGNAAQLALTDKLVDRIETTEEFVVRLAAAIDIPRTSLRSTSFRNYLTARPAPGQPQGEHIAIIRGRGPIMPGIQNEDMIGSQSMGKLLAKAREDTSVVAVVLRLDSPGGSATASDEIYDEIRQTQKAGKPVVVSMGSVAASGAYWIAMAANRVIASPTTLIGSIGIFAAVPTFENTAGQFGVTTDGIGTTAVADLGNPLRPFPPSAGEALQTLLQFGYSTFVDRVATGRNMPTSQVHTLAQGQVFLGADASRYGLVDKLGNLDDAVAEAAHLAGLTDPVTRELRREQSPREQFLKSLSSAHMSAEMTALDSVVRRIQSHAGFLESFTDPSHLYARSLECESCLF